MKVYLAGPVMECSDDECTSWRDYVKRRLGEINCIDPMRRDYRGVETDVDKAEEIVTLDLADIDASNLVIANCWRAGWGTPMEIFYANTNGKPVVAIVPDTNKISPWLRYHVIPVSTLDEAIDMVEAFLDEAIDMVVALNWFF